MLLAVTGEEHQDSSDEEHPNRGRLGSRGPAVVDGESDKGLRLDEADGGASDAKVIVDIRTVAVLTGAGGDVGLGQDRYHPIGCRGSRIGVVARLYVF